jgi:hypothetical protein
MKHKLALSLVVGLCSLVSWSAPSEDEVENPVEVGAVRWGRDLAAAQQASGETGKPVLLLFQEVPGCSGCQDFGKTVLSSPLLVEAIEDEFLPVLVYNNRDGEDRELLERFDEPAWNYQVVRFLDAEGADVIPRKDRVWDLGGVAARMIEALQVAERALPPYLQALAVENAVEHHATSAFAMDCFWTGERTLGALDGVISTEAGWLEGREVTRVTYDTRTLSLERLTEVAAAAQCAEKVYASGDEAEALTGVETGTLDGRYRQAKASDQKKQIEDWAALKAVPDLTDMQRTKLNALAPEGREAALVWLSPRQRRAFDLAAAED